MEAPAASGHFSWWLGSCERLVGGRGGDICGSHNWDCFKAAKFLFQLTRMRKPDSPNRLKWQICEITRLRVKRSHVTMHSQSKYFTHFLSNASASPLLIRDGDWKCQWQSNAVPLDLSQRDVKIAKGRCRGEQWRAAGGSDTFHLTQRLPMSRLTQPQQLSNHQRTQHILEFGFVLDELWNNIRLKSAEKRLFFSELGLWKGWKGGPVVSPRQATMLKWKKATPFKQQVTTKERKTHKEEAKKKKKGIIKG